jgi:hypothetical protein
MVRIINGEIVQDDDPRLKKKATNSSEGSNRFGTLHPMNSNSGIQSAEGGSANPAQSEYSLTFEALTSERIEIK